MNEFTAETLLYTLHTEPKLPIYVGAFCSRNLKSTKVYEIEDPTYRRQSIKLEIIDKYVRNVNMISFPRASKRWEHVISLGIFDAQEEGNLLLMKSIGSIINVESNKSIAFLEGDLCIYVGNLSIG